MLIGSCDIGGSAAMEAANTDIENPPWRNLKLWHQVLYSLAPKGWVHQSIGPFSNKGHNIWEWWYNESTKWVYPIKGVIWWTSTLPWLSLSLSINQTVGQDQGNMWQWRNLAAYAQWGRWPWQFTMWPCLVWPHLSQPHCPIFGVLLSVGATHGCGITSPYGGRYHCLADRLQITPWSWWWTVVDEGHIPTFKLGGLNLQVHKRTWTIMGVLSREHPGLGSYQGEILGLMAIHLILQAIKEVTPGLRGLVHILSDSLSAWCKVENLPTYLIPTQCNHSDILNCSNFLFTWIFSHIKAHQDDG
jgi:hypothetical protein